ncbi:MAG: hypothetical protein NTX27_10505, partial [Verrucomicrobia bacterium]|nr:hypothetical protein [Verrucomicrobiota bacterium]
MRKRLSGGADPLRTEHPKTSGGLHFFYGLTIGMAEPPPMGDGRGGKAARQKYPGSVELPFVAISRTP